VALRSKTPLEARHGYTTPRKQVDAEAAARKRMRDKKDPVESLFKKIEAARQDVKSGPLGKALGAVAKVTGEAERRSGGLYPFGGAAVRKGAKFIGPRTSVQENAFLKKKMDNLEARSDRATEKLVAGKVAGPAYANRLAREADAAGADYETFRPFKVTKVKSPSLKEREKRKAKAAATLREDHDVDDETAAKVREVLDDIDAEANLKKAAVRHEEKTRKASTPKGKTPSGERQSFKWDGEVYEDRARTFNDGGFFNADDLAGFNKGLGRGEELWSNRWAKFVQESEEKFSKDAIKRSLTGRRSVMDETDEELARLFRARYPNHSVAVTPKTIKTMRANHKKYGNPRYTADGRPPYRSDAWDGPDVPNAWEGQFIEKFRNGRVLGTGYPYLPPRRRLKP